MGNMEIHIAPGPTVAECLQEGLTLSPHQVLVHHDLLSHGPLPRLDSLDEWLERRQAYLRSLDVEDQTFTFAEQDRDVLSNREQLRHASTITLWIGTGLPEQLLLAWLVALLQRLGVDTAKCQIVQFDRCENYEVVAVGLLNPSQFEEHPSQRRSMRL